MRTSLLGLLLMLMACSAATADRIPLDGTTRGCGDAVLFLVSADNGTVLSLYWPGAASGTWEANDTTKTVTGEVGSTGVEVRMEVGRHLGQMVCNDAVEEEPVVENAYTASSGTVTLTLEVDIDTGSGQNLPIASGQITDLVLEAADGTVIRAAEVVFEPVAVGWFAG